MQKMEPTTFRLRSSFFVNSLAVCTSLNSNKDRHVPGLTLRFSLSNFSSNNGILGGRINFELWRINLIISHGSRTLLFVPEESSPAASRNDGLRACSCVCLLVDGETNPFTRGSDSSHRVDATAKKTMDCMPRFLFRFCDRFLSSLSYVRTFGCDFVRQID